DSASGLAKDIERYLNDDPVEACPPSAAYRLRKLARKHRNLLSTMAALGLVLLLGVVLSAWQALRARRAEAEARAQRDVALLNQVEAEQERNNVADANQTLKRIGEDLLHTTEREIEERANVVRANIELKRATDVLRRNLYFS